MISLIILISLVLVTNALPTDPNIQQEFEKANAKDNIYTPLSDLLQTQQETIKKLFSAATTQRSESEPVPQYTRKCVTIIRKGNEIKTIDSEEEPIEVDSIMQQSKQLDSIIESNPTEAAKTQSENLEASTETTVPEILTEVQSTPKPNSEQPHTKPNEPVFKRTCMFVQEQYETTIKRNDLENNKEQVTTTVSAPVDDSKIQSNNPVDSQVLTPQFAMMQPYSVDNFNSPYGQFIFYTYRRHQGLNELGTSTTTAKPTPSVSTTTQAPSTSTAAPTISSLPETLYSQQMKFVLPMPYTESEEPSAYPWDFDQFAYYPKYMQPSYVNVPVPYTPTFHMIRSLAIPKNLAGNYFIPSSQYVNYEKNE